MDIKLLKNKKITYFVVALAAGILMIVLSGQFTSPQKEVAVRKDTQPAKVDATYAEKRLQQILGTVKGVSDVSVFVTYENNGVKNTALVTENSSSSQNGEIRTERKDSVVWYKDSSGEQPFVKEEILPQVRGVIICAKGIDEKTKLLITDAVASAMGIPMYKVRVLPKN